MLYSEKVKLFAKQHPCEEITVDGARYRYVLCGKAGARTLVFLNGGMVGADLCGRNTPARRAGSFSSPRAAWHEATLRTIKQKYRLAPLMLWYMKHCNYEKLKPKLISASLPAHPGRNAGGDRLCKGYIRDDFPRLHAGKGRAYLEPSRGPHAPEAGDGGRFCGARGENSSDSSQSGLLFRKNAEGPDRAHARPEDRLRLRRAPVHCA